MSQAKLWRLRLGHFVLLKTVKNYIRKGIFPHVPCHSADCEQCASGSFQKRFDGALTNAPYIEILHFDKKANIRN